MEIDNIIVNLKNEIEALKKECKILKKLRIKVNNKLINKERYFDLQKLVFFLNDLKGEIK